MSKHIICIILDTWRLDYFSRMQELGGQIFMADKTPNIQRFASRCHLFERFVSGSHPCGPFRRDVWTGRYEFPFRGWGPLLTSDRTHARELGAAGFTTFYLTSNTALVDSNFWFGNNLVPENPIKGNYQAFFSGWQSVRGVVHDYASTDPIAPDVRKKWEMRCGGKPLNGLLEAYLRQRQHWQSEEDWPTARLFLQAAQWVERNRVHPKTFLMIDCFAPHEMFDPPPYYPAMFRKEDGTPHHPHPSYGLAEGLYSQAEMETIRADYAGDLVMVDRWLGHLFTQIEIMGGLEDTLIVLTSDHGYYLGDHGFIGKPSAFSATVPLHACISRAPLLVYDPQTPQSTPVWRKNLVQGVDLYATLLDFAGVEIPAGTHGQSVLPVIRDGMKGREIGLCGNNAGLVQVTDGRHMLIPPCPLSWTEGADTLPGGALPAQYRNTLLYDWDQDPNEQNNLAAEHSSAEQELRTRGSQYLQAMEAPMRFVERIEKEN